MSATKARALAVRVVSLTSKTLPSRHTIFAQLRAIRTSEGGCHIAKDLVVASFLCGKQCEEFSTKHSDDSKDLLAS